MAQIDELNKIGIKEKMKTFIVNNFLLGANADDLSDNDSFLEKGIIDSTGILELVSFAQEEFDINIEDAELVLDNLDSLNNLEAFITKKKQG